MKPAVWHQCGDKSQKLVLEEIDHGLGTGVVISPRDLSPQNAESYAAKYHDRKVDVAVDPQFHDVRHNVGAINQWEFNNVREVVGSSRKVTPSQLDLLSKALHATNASVRATYVIAPGLVYDPGRPENLDVNRALFLAARRVGDKLGVPTLGTAVIGNAALASDTSFFSALSDATSVPADGWYYSVEFGKARIPNNENEVYRAGRGLLSLSAAGLPVVHAFAGPTGLIGVGTGATVVAVGHTQNLWKFTRDRWAPRAKGGGGGKAASRLFSRKLWGTLVYPDEIPLLPKTIAASLVEESPFAKPLRSETPFPKLSRWDAGKHLVYVVGSELDRILAVPKIRDRCNESMRVLTEASALHSEFRTGGLTLKDETGGYQQPWLAALRRIVADGKDDLAVLEAMRM